MHIHTHIKLAFQMSLKDCCKTMNMRVNLMDIYLLSSGIYKCTYAKKTRRRLNEKFSFDFLCLSHTNTNAEGQIDHYQPVVAVRHCFVDAYIYV